MTPTTHNKSDNATRIIAPKVKYLLQAGRQILGDDPRHRLVAQIKIAGGPIMTRSHWMTAARNSTFGNHLNSEEKKGTSPHGTIQTLERIQNNPDKPTRAISPIAG